MKREEKREKSRSAIVGAAKRAFAARGYDGVTLNGLCRENGISKGQFYHYFTSREDLYRACCESAFSAFAEFMENRAELRGDYRESLRGYVRARSEFFAREVGDGRFVLSAFSEVSPEAKEASASGRERLDSFNRRFFGEMLSSCRLREGITTEKALAYLALAREMYYFSRRERPLGTDVSCEDGRTAGEILEIVVNGIVEREESCGSIC
ncbi:MAG: TetR/AcrR family transcriptional regulator [Candidatus Borkfalkiaceae bacterium]|nr:TetR/AcrR family transcriptional regulator [Christensenellaceae bacterium]